MTDKKTPATAVGEQKRGISRMDLLSLALEIRETKDIKEMAELLETEKWAVVDVCRQEPLLWVLIRVTS